MNVLSLFDGISCGRLALERAGIKVDTYFASEIDKYAIKISKKNYPDIIQMGDIKNWKTWNLPKIDLIIGGSPCQGFSTAGKGLNFDDPRSKLFFDFVNIKNTLDATYFLLENVSMKKEWRDIISSYVGVEPIKINSSLVSAQNRKRFYWTNIPNITQPDDRGILLKDIILEDVFPVALHNIYGGFKEAKVRVYTEKSPTIVTSGGGHIPAFVFKAGLLHTEDIVSFVKSVPYKELKKLNCIRTFHPVECERLQTLPDNYTEGCSNNQRYKMVGNGWTVDVIAHILSFMLRAGSRHD